MKKSRSTHIKGGSLQGPDDQVVERDLSDWAGVSPENWRRNLAILRCEVGVENVGGSWDRGRN